MQPEPTKVCSRCNERKPWSAFYKRRVRGKVYCESRCKPCSRAHAAEYVAARPEKRRQYNRTRYERVRADPERYAIRLDQVRESKRRKNGITPDKYRVSRRMREGGAAPRETVPVEPFSAWLADRVVDAGGVQPLARVLGMQERRVRALMSGTQPGVEWVTVDKAVTAWGDPDAINRMYPLSSASF